MTVSPRKMNGKVIAVHGPAVDVQFQDDELPGIYEVLLSKTTQGVSVTLEVMEHVGKGIVRCIALNSTMDLPRGADACPTGNCVQIPVGEATFGRVMNALGQPIDAKGPIQGDVMRPIRRPRVANLLNPKEQKHRDFKIMETGIKMIDFLFPLLKGSKNGMIGGAALGKSTLTLELIHNVIEKHQGVCVFSGIGERVREGHELYEEFQKTGVAHRVALVYGQMNESSGARFETAMAGITLAEYLQQQKKDVLFFADSVFRFAQAGMEISTLLGHIPSETGYQPTLAEEMSEFHERIRSSEHGSITAVEAVYVPADDLTDPAVVTIFSYLDSIMVLSRARMQAGLYPAIDPLISSSINLDPLIVGNEHFNVAKDVLRILKKLEELQSLVSVIGIDELSKEDTTFYHRGLKLQNYFTQPFFTAEVHTGLKGAYVPLEKTIHDCKHIVQGRFDTRPDEDFYMIGSIEELEKKA